MTAMKLCAHHIGYDSGSSRYYSYYYYYCRRDDGGFMRLLGLR